MTYDAPGASQIPNDSIQQGTVTFNINAGGDTAGFYWDAQGFNHGFIRHSNGSFVQVIPPRAVRESVCPGDCLNNGGAVAGYSKDASGFRRGYIRSAAGAFTTIAKPGAIEQAVYGINNGNRVTGYYIDKTVVIWGFILGANKRRIVFQDPKASETYGNGTVPVAINDAGAVTGYYVDAQGVVHGFYRSPTGKFSEFDPKGSVFTEPEGINARGTVTGFWLDAQGANHGFIWRSH